jgi:LDH2 family malate/lactate/ureidoglycolate dehydrogenase
MRLTIWRLKMAIYPRSETDQYVNEENLRLIVSNIFTHCGMSPEDAGLLAQTLVHSDLRGIHSHGVLRVPDYVEKLTRQGVNPKGRPAVVSKRAGAIVVDGGNAMGQISGTFAMRQAMDTAKETGIAYSAVRGSNHCGALDWYTMMAARENMIGIAGTNALPTMAPWGGTDKIVGINPLSVAIPAASGRDFVLDFAFGATAHGKIRVYQQKNAPIPEGWAFDQMGNPTTSAATALEGLIQPIGQHKGIGLGMAVGMLSSLLSGAAYGLESGNMVDGAKPGVDGHFFLAIDISAFEDTDVFKQRVDKIADEVHASGKRDGSDQLFMPGEIEQQIARQQAFAGILLAAETVDGIAAAARKCDVDTSPLFAV